MEINLRESFSKTQVNKRSRKPEEIVASSYSRSVQKTGRCNLKKKRKTGNITLFISDILTSMVDARWRTILFLLIITFLSSWFFFALIWWVIAYAHGDLTNSPYQHTSDPCVTLVTDLLTAFLFSIETQYSTGYGDRSPTTQCPEAVFILIIQCLFGLMFQSIMIGFVFTKISRPKGRVKAILFSEKAVICVRDGILCLMFRLADERKSNVIDCKVRAWILLHRITPEGELLLHHQKKLKISVDEGGAEILLLWPVIVVHRIDNESPLFDISFESLYESNLEIVVSLVCTTQTTGRPTEVRCSYIANEILWGHRFQSMISYHGNVLQADYDLFNSTESVTTALSSAKQLYESPI